MAITKVRLENFKRFQSLELSFTDGVNILVGGNDAGKSTVMGAIHLAMTGVLDGRHIRTELSQHLFNNEAVDDYLKSLKTPPHLPLPSILIEIHLTDGKFPLFEGDGNSTKSKATGFFLKIQFDDIYQKEYQNLVDAGEIQTLPLEYYGITFQSFAREVISPRTTPMRSAFIDSSTTRYQSGSDVYISRIVRDFLDTPEVVGISQAYRRMKESFRNNPSIAQVNAKLKQAPDISAKAVTLSAELPAKSDWEDSLITCVEDVPFHYIGKGEQSLIKTKLALMQKKAKEAAVILLEEPENHLTHANLNGLLKHLKDSPAERQIVISTHSSFVANKLGLQSLLLLNDGNNTRLTSLDSETQRFFEKIAGYDTLRMILAKKAILVEGDSDELIIQKAYHVLHGKLPIEDGIDVLSVGTSFLRFLEIADRLKQQTTVVTDNDSNLPALKKKYSKYLLNSGTSYVKICFDDEVDTGEDIDGKPFNYNTLEPKLLKANGVPLMNKILGTNYTKHVDMHRHMRAEKTACALKVFGTTETVKFPKYIIDAVS